MAQISTMQNGGYLIECQIENEAPESCPWRSPETCKHCDNVSCPRKITEENEG